MAGVIWRTYPVLKGWLADYLYGRDMLKEEQYSDRPAMLYSLEEARMLILGPYRCSEGFLCAYTINPIYVPAPTYDYDWGCGYQPYNCTPLELCWNNTTKTK